MIPFLFPILIYVSSSCQITELLHCIPYINLFNLLHQVSVTIFWYFCICLLCIFPECSFSTFQKILFLFPRHFLFKKKFNFLFWISLKTWVFLAFFRSFSSFIALTNSYDGFVLHLEHIKMIRCDVNCSAIQSLEKNDIKGLQDFLEDHTASSCWQKW